MLPYIVYTVYIYVFIYIHISTTSANDQKQFLQEKKPNQSKVTAVLGQSEMILDFFFLKTYEIYIYKIYVCKKINNMITWVRISTIAHSFQDALFSSFFFLKPKYDLLTSHSVRDMCGSNLNQSRGYKISLESLLHRVQSCGQSEFPSYRSTLSSLFRLDPVNDQSINQCSKPHMPTSNLSVGGLNIDSFIIYRATFHL